MQRNCHTNDYELLKNKFARGAGTITGVVSEGHLKRDYKNHSLSKKSGTINLLNYILKAAGVIELSQFRQIQLLGDHNSCVIVTQESQPLMRLVN